MANITGTFIDFAVGMEYSTLCMYYPELLTQPGFWARELADMREAGITDVIIARIMELGRTHYHSPLFQEWGREDYTAAIMAAAEAEGMSVWLGGHVNCAFWDKSWDFRRMMHRDLNVNVEIFEELWEQYEGHPALAGFYVSNEPDRDNLDTPERADALAACLHGIYEVMKREAGLPVLVSPFYSKSLSPAELAAWWDAFLDRPMFDILAMQDGVGCYPRRDLRPENVAPYYAALAPVYAAHGITFWNNVETFASPWPTPAPFERIDAQYRAGAPYVSRSITWEYGHFLSRQQVGEERYQAFKAWNLHAE